MRQRWVWVLVGAVAVGAVVFGLATWLDFGSPWTRAIGATVQVAVLTSFQLLIAGRLKRSQEANQAAFHDARTQADAERSTRAEEAARFYEQQRGRRPWR